MTTPARILVVDDEAGIRFFLKKVLTGDGYQVLTAESGEAALECIAAEEFDLALIDLRMGEVGGLEVLAALRRKTSTAAAIVLTAHGSLETAVEALRLGANDYLFKPCQTSDLRQSVRLALGKRRREQRQRELLAELGRTMTQDPEELQTAAGAPTAAPQSTMVSPGGESPRPEEQRGLVVDSIRHAMTLDGRPLVLSPTEFGLLAYLVGAAPRVVGPQELIREVQGYDCEPYEARDMVRYSIHRIRQKAKNASGAPDVIVTIRGVGYTLGVKAVSV